MTDLSGRVENIENQIVYILQDLLQKPDIYTYSQLQSIWNQSHSELTNQYQELDSEVQELQSLYANIVLNTGSSSSITGLSESFETVAKNLKQYPYSLYYDTSGLLTGITYQINSSSYINKNIEYNSSGLLYHIYLTGNSVPSIDMHKYLLYSGSTLTGIYYS